MRTHRSVPAVDRVQLAFSGAGRAPQPHVARFEVCRSRRRRIETQRAHDCTHRLEHLAGVPVLSHHVVQREPLPWVRVCVGDMEGCGYGRVYYIAVRIVRGGRPSTEAGVSTRVTKDFWVPHTCRARPTGGARAFRSRNRRARQGRSTTLILRTSVVRSRQ